MRVVAFYPVPDPVGCIVLHNIKILQAREWGGYHERRFFGGFLEMFTSLLSGMLV